MSLDVMWDMLTCMKYCHFIDTLNNTANFIYKNIQQRSIQTSKYNSMKVPSINKYV